MTYARCAWTTRRLMNIAPGPISSAPTSSAWRVYHRTRRTFARHLDTPPDPVEDPFTGSATGGMAAYLWHHHLIDSPRFTAEQGHWLDRPGRASVEVVGPPDDIETVKVGGGAALVMEGTLMLGDD